MSSIPNTTTTVSSGPTTLKVAVIGGGIGGLALALGLLEHPHIDVQVYESAPSFGEIGAGVSIAYNAQRALELISPAAKTAFDKHATSNMWASKADHFADYFVVSQSAMICTHSKASPHHNRTKYFYSLSSLPRRPKARIPGN